MTATLTDYDVEAVAAIVPTDDVELRAVLARCAVDTQFFAQTFMKDAFDEAMTYQNTAVWQLLDDERLPKVCICGWRGFGKTTMFTAKVVASILFRQHPFIMLINKSHDDAASVTENAKMELLSNETIREVFGFMKAQKYDGLETAFSRKSWFACDPKTGAPVCFVTPKGAGQHVRGRNIRMAGRYERPTFIGIDDLEDDDVLDNPDLRKKLRVNWFEGALLPCVPKRRPNPHTKRWNKADIVAGKPPWRIVYQDTLKHEDALIAHLMNDSDWTSVRFPQSELRKEGEGKDKKNVYYSLVPDLISHEQVRAEAAHAKEHGSLDTYCREKMCLPISPETAAWTKDSFKYYREKLLGLSEAKNIERIIVVDPARTATARSAFTAILAAAADCVSGKIYLRHLINERLEPEQAVDRVLSLAIELNTRVIAVEDAGLKLHIQHQYYNEISRRGLNIEMVWLTGRQRPEGDFGVGRDAPKRARASMIIPYYRKGYVYHEESLRDSALEMQQLSYPKAPYWDALDCAGYLIQVLAMGGRYFAYVDNPDEESFPDDEDYDQLGERIRQRQWAYAECN